MPKMKAQGIVFGIIMSYAMAFGMEVYNTAINQGFHLAGAGFSAMTNLVFAHALKETAFMGLIVILFSSLWGNRAGAAFAARHCDPQKDNPYVCRVIRQAGTVVVMCPTMSLVASVLFNVVMAGMPAAQLPAIWVGDRHQELPDGLFLEHVRRSTLYALALQPPIPKLPIRTQLR